MPTILTHPAVPLAVAVALGAKVIPPRLAVAGVIAAILPDLDVIAFRFGIPYAHDLGHRGISHSFFFALIIGLAAALCSKKLGVSRCCAFLFLFMATASHLILDAFTNGGLGVAALWPFSHERYFAPLRIIEVSPIGVSRFLSERGLAVLKSEMLWVWTPCLVFALAGFIARHCYTRSRPLPTTAS